MRKSTAPKSRPREGELSTCLVDTNKEDVESPNYRSRLVGREVRIDSRFDLFAPTPPLEAMKFLISM